MTARNRTHEYLRLRDVLRREAPSPVISDQKALLAGDEDEDVRVKIGQALPPQWVDVVEDIQADIAKIKTHLKTLQNCQGCRLRVQFLDDDQQAVQERELEATSQLITSLLRSCEKSLKLIAVTGPLAGGDDNTVRLNVMRNIGGQLQQLSKQFRRAQKDFMGKLKGQEAAGSEFFFDDEEKSGQPRSLEEAAERGMTTQELAQLEDFQQTADHRHQEIIKIAQSVNDINSLFRELSVLVIEQGTVLDRIDYNVEATLVKVKQGTAELVIADNYSKKARSIKCIMFLALVALVLILILILKHTTLGPGSLRSVTPADAGT